MSGIEKIKISGITRKEFIEATEPQVQKEAGNIFDKYNTDKTKSKSDEDYLDKKEQEALANYLNEEKDQSKVKAFIDAYNKIIKGAKSDDIESISTAKAPDAVSENQDATEASETATPPEAKPDSETEASQDNRPARPQKRDLVPIAPEWKMQRMGDAKAKELKLHELKTAQEVLDVLIKQDKYKIDNDAQKDVLLADLIKYNPSIFNEKGEVYSDALWDRFDFPEKVKELYAKGKKTPTAGTSAQRTSSKWFDKSSRVTKEKINELKLKDKKDSSAILDALIMDAKIDESKIDKDKLAADFIAKNPSLFDNDGKLKANADWTKLDFPSASITELYAKTDDKKPDETSNKPEDPKANESEETSTDNKPNAASEGQHAAQDSNFAKTKADYMKGELITFQGYQIQRKGNETIIKKGSKSVTFKNSIVDDVLSKIKNEKSLKVRLDFLFVSDLIK